MAQPQPQSLTDKIKSAFGLPSQSAPRPVKVPDQRPMQRQDSFPGLSFGVCRHPSLAPGLLAASLSCCRPGSEWREGARLSRGRGCDERCTAGSRTAPLHPPLPSPSCAQSLLLAEICSTPSDVGLFEVAHNKDLHGPDGKFAWRKVRVGSGDRSGVACCPVRHPAAAAAAAGIFCCCCLPVACAACTLLCCGTIAWSRGATLAAAAPPFSLLTALPLPLPACLSVLL